MNKKHIWALVVIGICAVILILNARGSVHVNVIFDTISAAKAIVFLAFISIGVLIGILFK